MSNASNTNYRARQKTADKLIQLISIDDRVRSALFIGSAARGRGTVFSDLDFYLYLSHRAWSPEELDGWLTEHGLVVSEHFWTSHEKHHMVIGRTRTDFTILPQSRAGDIAAWPALFFAKSSIIKDDDGVLSRGYDDHVSHLHLRADNDASNYKTAIIEVAAHLVQGRVIEAMNRKQGIVEALARVFLRVPTGSEEWCRPLRLAETTLGRAELNKLREIQSLNTESDLRDFLLAELERICEDGKTPVGTKLICSDLSDGMLKARASFVKRRVI